MNITIEITTDDAGHFIASVPQYPGCHTQGTTLAEALQRIQETIALHQKSPHGGSETATKEETEKELSRQIRVIAGQLGELHHKEPVGVSDSENYDFQVMVGLALATVQIIDYQPARLFYWLGYCLIDLGLDPDPRIQSLIDALEREVFEQLDAEDEEGGDEKGE